MTPNDPFLTRAGEFIAIIVALWVGFIAGFCVGKPSKDPRDDISWGQFRAAMTVGGVVLLALSAYAVLFW